MNHLSKKLLLISLCAPLMAPLATSAEEPPEPRQEAPSETPTTTSEEIDTLTANTPIKKIKYLLLPIPQVKYHDTPDSNN